MLPVLLVGIVVTSEVCVSMRVREADTVTRWLSLLGCEATPESPFDLLCFALDIPCSGPEPTPMLAIRRQA